MSLNSPNVFSTCFPDMPIEQSPNMPPAARSQPSDSTHLESHIDHTVRQFSRDVWSNVGVWTVEQWLTVEDGLIKPAHGRKLG